MNHSNRQESRAKNLRNRLFMLRRSVKWVAEEAGVSRTWASQVLNGQAKSEELLDKIEKIIESEEGGDGPRKSFQVAPACAA